MYIYTIPNMEFKEKQFTVKLILQLQIYFYLRNVSEDGYLGSLKKHHGCSLLSWTTK